MSDIRFQCPSCATALAVAAKGAGQAVSCPNCGASIRVPGHLRVNLSGIPPPIAPGHSQHYQDYDLGITIRTRNCTMAYVALALVCLSFLTAGILLLPGIVCGHIAVGQCNRDPQMTGKGYAVAALIVGYAIVAMIALVVLGICAILASATNGGT